MIHFEVRARPSLYSLFDLISLCAIGVMGWVCNWLLIMALNEEKIISRIYPFKYLLVIAGVVLDMALFKMSLAFATYVGLVLIGVNFGITFWKLLSNKH